MGLTFRLGQLPTSLFTDASNNVGIGAAPSGSYKLEVTGTGRFTGSTILASTSGNVGIGTTPQGVGSNKTLEISDTGLIYAGSGQLGLVNNAYNNGSWIYKTTAAASIYTTDGGTHNFQTAPSGTAGGTVTFTQRMFINNAGNVGIGTGSPNSQLSVVNNTSGTATTMGLYNSTLAAGSGGGYEFWYNNSIRLGGIYQKTTSDGNNFYMSFESYAGAGGATERMRITSAGDVGIGQTSPRGKLDVAGNIFLNNGTQIQITGNSGATGLQMLGQDNDISLIGTMGAQSLVFRTNSVERMRIDTDGNVKCLQIYNNTSSGGKNVGIASNGFIYSFTSSIKYKTNVEDLDYNLVSNAIDNLRPVYYKPKDYKGDVKEGWSYYGLIAEEVDKVEPRFVIYKTVDYKEEERVYENGDVVKEQVEYKLENPEPESVDYARISILCLAEIQHQKKIIQELNERLNKAGL
jgi:hypothetical protein